MRAGASRLGAAGRKLDGDQRFAAAAAVALLAAMFLPWYEKSVVVPGSRAFATDTISAFGAVSFVEAAIFLVAAGVVVLVLTRAEGGRYHLPGGDGTVIFGAGLWASALIFYRVFDRPDVSGAGGTVGIQWGFFVAFVAAGALAFAGRRMRVAARPEPPAREPRPGRRSVPEPEDWSDESTEVVPASRARTEAVPASRARTEVVPPESRTEVVPAAEARPAAEAGPADTPEPRRPVPRPPGSRPARDRAVRREDAEQLELHDPPDAPPLPGSAPRARDRR
ncbi:MAG: hypothetical protein QOE31_21 [Solirubrobacteraceae bacterium]|nr:hypothetical protein [Solirubrobacteraceae bacterium]